jgi:hypothetical protein
MRQNSNFFIYSPRLNGTYDLFHDNLIRRLKKNQQWYSGKITGIVE